MLNMEAAAADDLAAFVAANPMAAPHFAKPEDIVLEAGMRDVMLDLHDAGEPTTREDLARNGYLPAEIERLGARAAAQVRAVLALRGQKPRIRMACGRA